MVRLDLNSNISKEKLRSQLKEYIYKPFYESCRHHGDSENEKRLTAKAAEQGYIDFIGK